MDNILTPDQQKIRDAAFRIASKFGPEYWLERDRKGGFPEEFYRACADDGWLGIAMPEAYGGAGLGIPTRRSFCRPSRNRAAQCRRLRPSTSTSSALPPSCSSAPRSSASACCRR